MEIEVVVVDSSYGPASVVESSDDIFVDMDYGIAINLPPGRYRIVLVDE